MRSPFQDRDNDNRGDSDDSRANHRLSLSYLIATLSSTFPASAGFFVGVR